MEIDILDPRLYDDPWDTYAWLRRSRRSTGTSPTSPGCSPATEAPEEFRIDRDPNPHLGFGIGTHLCLGATLARAEIKTVFEVLFARLRDIRVPDGVTVERGDSTLVLALQHVPAVFTPQAPR